MRATESTRELPRAHESHRERTRVTESARKSPKTHKSHRERKRITKSAGESPRAHEKHRKRTRITENAQELPKTPECPESAQDTSVSGQMRAPSVSTLGNSHSRLAGLYTFSRVPVIYHHYMHSVAHLWRP